MSLAPRLCIFGAPDDTGNLGVSALLHAMLDGVATRLPNADVMVYDHGLRLRLRRIEVDGRTFRYGAHGARASRRFWRSDTFRVLDLAARLGGLGNAGARALANADAVLDVGGGDSFSDIYGRARFRSVVAPRLAAQRLGRPLLLLPQTYGPFTDPNSATIARRIVRYADVAWARDVDSLDALKRLVGAEFDPLRHRLGVDLAFGLRPRVPRSLPERMKRWLEPSTKHVVVGVNVSGLVYDRDEARLRYGLNIDYPRAVERIVRLLLREPHTRVILIPHVRGYGGHESDEMAADDVARRVAPVADDRLAVAPFSLDAQETKWLIGKLDWFCGTRMHSTIAALSQRVPTAAIAYSMKTRGVFASCGQADHVADARHLDDAALIDKVWHTYTQRSNIRQSLDAHVPGVLSMAAKQLDDLAAHLCAKVTTRADA